MLKKDEVYSKLFLFVNQTDAMGRWALGAWLGLAAAGAGAGLSSAMPCPASEPLGLTAGAIHPAGCRRVPNPKGITSCLSGVQNSQCFIESLRLEKSSQIIKSNRHPVTTVPATHPPAFDTTPSPELLRISRNRGRPRAEEPDRSGVQRRAPAATPAV